jgi:hypothetical protein
MVLHPEFDQLEEEVASYFRPPFRTSASGRTLDEEDIFGRSKLHQYTDSPSFLDNHLFTAIYGGNHSSIIAEVNKYDVHGLIPFMHFLLRAFKEGSCEDEVVAQTRAFIVWVRIYALVHEKGRQLYIMQQRAHSQTF